MKRLFAAAGLGSALLVGAAMGPTVVSAQTEETTPAAEAPAVRPDRGSRFVEVLDGLVADGTLTQEQADKVAAALVSAAPEGNHGGNGRPEGHRPQGSDREEARALVAGTLGLTEDEVADAIKSGSTLAELADESGLGADALIVVMVDAGQDHLAQAVADGNISQERADDVAARMTERVTDRVNGESRGSRNDQGYPGPGTGGPAGWPSSDG